VSEDAAEAEAAGLLAPLDLPLHDLGDRVLAQFCRSKRWYTAHIVEYRGYGRYKIAWDDGDKKDVYKSPLELQGVRSWCVAGDASATAPREPDTGEEAFRRSKAFRAASGGNVAVLREALEGLPVTVWSLWQNEAKLDLCSLAQRHGIEEVSALLVELMSTVCAEKDLPPRCWDVEEVGRLYWPFDRVLARRRADYWCTALIEKYNGDGTFSILWDGEGEDHGKGATRRPEELSLKRHEEMPWPDTKQKCDPRLCHTRLFADAQRRCAAKQEHLNHMGWFSEWAGRPGMQAWGGTCVAG